MRKENLRAHLSMLAATLLFGANYWIAKGLMPDFLQPLQIIFLRVSGTVIISFILQISIREIRVLKIERSDFPRLIISGLLGVTLNQVMFFKGLNLTTPVDAAIINSGSPMLVLVFAAFILKDKISFPRLIGIILGASGALLLILSGNPISPGGGHFSGNILIIVNTLSWSLYLVVSKPLMVKYNPFLLMKWIFLIGFVSVLPFCFSEISTIDSMAFTSYTWFSILYIIIGTTFIGYFLITYSLKRLPSSVVAYYNYLQPVIVAIIGIAVFSERLSWIKILCAMLVFIGIYLVTRRKHPSA